MEEINFTDGAITPFDYYAVIKAYLSVIRPWCVGKDNRGWLPSDFSPEVIAMRTEFIQTIYPLTPFDHQLVLYLPTKVIQAIFELNQLITNFNTLVDRVNREHTYPEVGGKLVKMLHLFCIGSAGTGGLYDKYFELCALCGVNDKPLTPGIDEVK